MDNGRIKREYSNPIKVTPTKIPDFMTNANRYAVEYTPCVKAKPEIKTRKPQILLFSFDTDDFCYFFMNIDETISVNSHDTPLSISTSPAVDTKNYFYFVRMLSYGVMMILS